MSTGLMKNACGIVFFVLSSIVSTAGYAWYGGVVSVGFGGGNVHYHGDDIRVYNPGGYGYRGGYYYGGGPAIIVPNVIINAPVQRYYVPQCEEVEVCNSYGECWLDQFCN